MMDRIKKFFVAEEGATMVEYALMVALIAIVCLLVVAALGQNIGLTFDNAQNALPGTGTQVQPS